MSQYAKRHRARVKQRTHIDKNLIRHLIWQQSNKN